MTRLTDERLEEIRTYVATVEEYSGGLTLYEASNELLVEVDRLRAALQTSTKRLANTLDELRATLERAREGCR